MKAAVKQEPKPGINLTNVPEPKCGPNDVILRINAAAICGSDLHFYKWDEYAKKTIKNLPVILGHEFMGEVAEIGNNVKGFSIGERVAADPGVTCGVCIGCRTGQFNLCEHREVIGGDRNGAFAQYTLVPPDHLYKLSDEVTDEMGAFLESFALAVHAVEKASLKPGDTAVVIGAGPIGLSTLICAQAAGAKKIYITERNSPRRIKAAEALGADAVINVDETDPVEAILRLNRGRKVDVVFEVSSANAITIPQAMGFIRKGGEIIAVGQSPTPNVELPLMTMIRNEVSLITVRGRTHTSWIRAINLIGKVNVAPIIGPVVGLDAIEEAFRKAINGEVIKTIIKPN